MAKVNDNATSYNQEVERGERFKFGNNWLRFLSVLDDSRIAEAERSLLEKLGAEGLKGKTFLDVGSGCGLFSLAAMRLGAERVYSFDYDPQSVACTQELRHRYFTGASNWIINQGSALDQDSLASLGEFDVVYSWGVLQHTGNMWMALGNMPPLVAPGGTFFISIYNDQGEWSLAWKSIKRTYNWLPQPLKFPFAILVMVPLELKSVLGSVVALKPMRYVRTWTHYCKAARGMSRWYDLIDWIGGYPFECAKPEEIFFYFRDRGFVLVDLRTCGRGHGCNEFVFQKRNY